LLQLDNENNELDIVNKGSYITVNLYKLSPFPVKTPFVMPFKIQFWCVREG
jgi:hypothetical protein